MHRLKGELILMQSEDTSRNQEDAEGCFSKALEIARRQAVKSLELRAAMSLSRLRQTRRKKRTATEF